MKRILVIDTIVGAKWNIADILVIAGYEVMQVSGHLEGLSHIQQHKPNLVICNTYNPQSECVKLLQVLSQDSTIAEVPLLFITGRVVFEEMNEETDTAKVRFLQKPYTITELLGQVKLSIKE